MIEMVACTDGTFDFVKDGEIIGNASGFSAGIKLLKAQYPTEEIQIVMGPHRWV